MNSQTEKNTEKAIFRTIAFFDLFDYPLTLFELKKYLEIKCVLNEVEKALQNTVGRLEKKQGFYFLLGREEIIKTRLKRYNYSDEKFKRALWVTKIFRFIPWIEGVAIGNIIGAHNLKKEGDIDFFIITQNNRIWATRFFCVLVAKFFGLRPQKDNVKDKICLSFFVSEENLDLKSLMLAGEKDIYFIYWLVGLVPIYDRDNIFDKFFQANDWVKKYLPNWQPSEIHFQREVRAINFLKTLKVFGFGLDKIFKKIQLKKMSPELKKIMNQDSKVVVNDKILKFHLNDRRQEYIQKYSSIIFQYE